jgi:Fic family protein
MLNRDVPHVLAKLPPAVELETRAVLKKTIAARAALSELKATAPLLPNQSLMMQTIALQEAKTSSEIENIVTTHDALFHATIDDGQHADAATKEVLAYQRALWHGFDVVKREGRPITAPLMEKLVALVKGADIGVRRMTGTKLARPDGQIPRGGPRRERIIYTPPEGEDVLRGLLGNLVEFMHDTDVDVDPLVRMAVMHYQFEAIHPFVDGNGRTGRILNILYLVEQGLLDVPILYLSQYVLAHKTKYYEGLRAVTEEGAWESWILFMLTAIEEIAKVTVGRMRAIVLMMEETRVRIQRDFPSIYSKDLIESLFLHPYTKISFLEQRGLGKRLTATKHLRTLVAAGVLSEEKVGREVYFRNDALIALLKK